MLNHAMPSLFRERSATTVTQLTSGCAVLVVMLFTCVNVRAQSVSSYHSLRFVNSSSPTNSVTLIPPSGITSYSLQLPGTIGSAGQVLSNDGSGQLSWLSGSQTAISSLTGATATSSISNGAYHTVWQWDQVNGGTTALTLSSSSTAAASNAQTLLRITSSGNNNSLSNSVSVALNEGTSMLDGGKTFGVVIDARGGTNNYALIVSAGQSVLARESGTSDNFTTLRPSAILNIGRSDVYPPFGSLKLTSGTLLTTPQAGAWEYDGTVFYSTVDNDDRGVIPSKSFVVLTGDNTLTSQTAVQPLFDGGGGSTNGRIVLPAGTYEFECLLYLTSLSGTGTFGFAFGGTATIASQRWATVGRKVVTGVAITAPAAGSGIMATAADLGVVTANTGTAGCVWITGVIRLSAGGTLIPQISLETAAAAIVKKNSFFMISPLGSSTVTKIGNWQ
ncbi:MAG: hypothetical protein FGM24_09315 [Candidatus Kapabacteria bacterium]|nr:hypothetical protein [Candidatus Kapabacteria bacterium]